MNVRPRAMMDDVARSERDSDGMCQVPRPVSVDASSLELGGEVALWYSARLVT